MNESKDIEKIVPKDLADPRVHSISLNHLKKTLANIEKDKDDILQTYKDEINRLLNELDETNKAVKSLSELRYFKERLSINCPQVNVKLTILQCANRVKKGECKSCLDRTALLDMLEARPR
jgi:uncharacterized protein YwgA